MTDKLKDLFTQLQDWSIQGGSAPFWLLGIVGALMLFLAFGPLWPRVRIGVTLFHELGHALAGLSIGGRVNKIRLEANTSGVTHWEFSGRRGPGRLRTAWVAGAGYLAPALFGGLALLALLSGWSRAYGTFLVALTAITLLLWVRNMWGFIFTSFVVVGGGALLTSGNLGSEILCALSASFLIAGGLHASFEHLSEIRSDSSDSEVVARNILIPRRVVQIYFLLMSALIPAAFSTLYHFKGHIFSI